MHKESCLKDHIAFESLVALINQIEQDNKITKI